MAGRGDPVAVHVKEVLLPSSTNTVVLSDTCISGFTVDKITIN